MIFGSRIAVAGLIASIIVIFAGSLYPFQYRVPTSGGGAVTALLLSAARWLGWGDFMQNIVFYAPTGMLAVLVMPAGTTLAKRLTVISLSAAALSLGNELLQYYDEGRYTSAFDVYANTLGASLGGLGSAMSRERLGGRTG